MDFSERKLSALKQVWEFFILQLKQIEMPVSIVNILITRLREIVK